MGVILPLRACTDDDDDDDDELYSCVDLFIFRTHESSSFVNSHLKLFKNRLLLIRFNALTSKLLYSCCTLCFGVQGGRFLARAASADSAPSCIKSGTSP